GLKIFQNFTPVALIACTAPVTLVHDHKVKEVRRKFAVESGPPFVTRDRLVRSEVHLAAFYNFSFNLPACIPEWREDLVLRIIHENVPICEIQNPWPTMFALAVPSRAPKLVTDLECDHGFPGAGRK